MTYVFMSFASAHSGKNIGCCIVQVENPEDANEECKRLGIMPKACNQARGYVLEDEKTFQEQGMELNRLYTPEEMLNMGFAKG